MSEKISVQITATDGASRVFTQVASGAQKMGQSLDQAGDASKGVGKNFDEAGRSAQNLSQTLGDAYKVGQELGRSLIALGAIGTVAGASYRDQQVALANLTRTYGDSADELKTFADQLQSTTNFSNDEVLNALNNAGTLVRNYGFTVAEVQQVIAMSADLAAANGISLADASQKVVAALRGEAEGAEQLGLTLNQQAIDRNNLTLTMSNEEAAHFRLAAAAEQSGYAVGAAAEQADSAYGSFTELKDTIQDNLQAFGGMLGPLGEMGAFLADNALQVGALSLAFVQLGKTVAAVNTLSKAMTGVGVASNVLSLALGPVGLVAGAAAAVVGIGALARYLSDDYVSATDKANAASQEFIDNLIQMGQAGTLSRINQQVAQQGIIIDDYAKSLAATADGQNDFIERIEKFQTSLSGSGSAINAHTQAVKDMFSEDEIKLIDGIIDGNEDGALSFEELTAAAQQTDIAIANTGESAADYAANWSAAQADINEIMTQTDQAGIDAQTRLLQTLKNVGDGLQTMGGARKTIAEIRAEMEAAQAQAVATGDAMADMGTKAADGVVKWLDAGGDLHTLTDDIAKSMQDLGSESVALGGNLTRTFDAFELRAINSLDNVARSMAAMGAISPKLGTPGDTGAFDAAFQGVKANTNAVAEAQAGLQRGIEGAADAMSYQVGESQRLAAELERQGAALEKLNSQYADTFDDIRQQFTGPAETLDTIFGAIVGNTDKIAKSAQGVQDWADKLIGAADTYAEIDDLLQAGAITLDDYTAAQQSYNVIAAANASIQEDVLSIQAQLAPVIAESTSALAAQMDEIASGSTDAQLFALGMMDATTSAQALDLATSYLADRDTFGPMVQQAAELNPMLAQILEEMGLISYDPATGTVELRGTDEVMSDLDQMTAALDRLTQVQWVLLLDGDVTAAEAAFEQATGLAVDWDGKEATAVISADNGAALDALGEAGIELDGWDSSSGAADANVNDNASGTLANIAGVLNSLDGRSVTSTVTTVFQQIGQQVTGIFARNGGVIDGYAQGGVVAQMAEVGPELLHFPNGGVALARNPGIYTVPQGTYVDTAPATAEKLGGMGRPFIGELHVHTNGTNARQMAEDVARELVPAFAQMLRQHDASLGWAP
jgi:3-dehydroquinate dehydratase